LMRCTPGWFKLWKRNSERNKGEKSVAGSLESGVKKKISFDSGVQTQDSRLLRREVA
jgi:hypothetical protein